MKTLKLSENIDKKTLETVFLIAVCRQSGDKWQSKLVYSDFLSKSVNSINIFDCRLSSVDSSKSESPYCLQDASHKVSVQSNINVLEEMSLADFKMTAIFDIRKNHYINS